MEVCSLNQPLPYYMAYPMPFAYDDERVERRDFEYMKSMYPMAVKRILPYVEMECDRMSYTGSAIYDEYPDQLQIRMLCNRVFEKVKSENQTEDEWLKNLVQIMVFQELYQRRRQHRKDRRKFYL